jgi:methyl-accepting chemotaxis protein
VAALGTRLRSLDHCLQGLGDGLTAVADGDLTHEVQPVTTPVEVRAKDELAQQSETFNEMLAKAQGGLQAYNDMRDQLVRRFKLTA